MKLNNNSSAWFCHAKIWLRLFFLREKKIHWRWYAKIWLRLLFSRKIKVGFGPIATGENDLAERKWRIDPIINGINRESKKYIAGFFLRPEEMHRFDIVVIVKKINPKIMATAAIFQGKLIYDVVDNPNDEKEYQFYFRNHPKFLSRLDALILSTPIHQHLFKKGVLIEHPILNPPFKKKEREDGEVRILAQGYYENLKNLRFLETFLPSISQQVRKRIILYYHSEHQEKDTESVRYVKWSVQNCFSMMEQADIAVTIKNLNKPHQYTKPSTKVIAYMAAELPVICKPTAADRLVIRDRIDGFYAYRDEDWVRWISALASSHKLRRQMGRAAFKNVSGRYSLNEILKKYLFLVDSLR